MGTLDSLFQGTTPPATTNYNQNLTQIPPWLLNSTNSLISQANSVASEPYQQFPGPQVAPWTDAQNQALTQIQGMQGSYAPTLANATQMAQNASNPGALNAAQAYIPQAANAVQSALNPTAASMNPYIGNVVNQAKDQATQYWNNTLMPSINNQFTANGQYGSSANQRAANQGAAQVTQNIQDTANAGYAGAYNQAQTAGLQGAGTLANIGQLQGGLGYEQGMLGLQGAGTLSNIASTGQSLGLQGAGSLYNIGQAQQQQGQQNLDTAYQNWYNQTYYPQNQLNWLSSIVRGTANPSTTGSATTGTQVGALPGAQYGASPVSSAIGLYTGLQGAS